MMDEKFTSVVSEEGGGRERRRRKMMVAEPNFQQHYC
jgi:hypothetical protein